MIIATLQSWQEASAGRRETLAGQMATAVLPGSSVTYERVQVLAEQGLLEIPNSYIRPLEERPTIHEAPPLRDIPVIDLSEGTSNVSAEVGQACREWGFFQVYRNFYCLSQL